jgi:CHAT domain-containing protein
MRLFDLGPVEATQAAAQVLAVDVERGAERRAARDLHDRLLGPLATELAGLERLYLAPDGDLYLVPFAALLGPDKRRLAERLDLRVLQTGRDLLRPAPDRLATGLLALGGIDFNADAPTSSTTAPDAAVEPALSGIGAAELQCRAMATLRGDFDKLEASAREVRAVAALYRVARPDEPVEVWEGAKASEARLKALPRPP